MIRPPEDILGKATLVTRKVPVTLTSIIRRNVASFSALKSSRGVTLSNPALLTNMSICGMEAMIVGDNMQIRAGIAEGTGKAKADAHAGTGDNGYPPGEIN